MQFVSQGVVLMQDNDRKHTSKFCQRYIKSKNEVHVLQLMSWPAQSDHLNWCGVNLTEKSELNNLQVWLTSGNSCRKASVYIQFLEERMPRICRAEIATKGGSF